MLSRTDMIFTYLMTFHDNTGPFIRSPLSFGNSVGVYCLMKEGIIKVSIKYLGLSLMSYLTDHVKENLMY